MAIPYRRRQWLADTFYYLRPCVLVGGNGDPPAVFEALSELVLVGPLIALEDGLGRLPAAQLAEHLEWLVYEVRSELPPQKVTAAGPDVKDTSTGVAPASLPRPRTTRARPDLPTAKVRLVARPAALRPDPRTSVRGIPAGTAGAPFDPPRKPALTLGADGE